MKRRAEEEPNDPKRTVSNLPDHLAERPPKRYLDAIHPHPKDDCVVFDDSFVNGVDGERRHDYWMDWNMNGHYDKGGSKSATTFIHEFFEHFDADAILDRMMSKEDKWQTTKYADLSEEAKKNYRFMKGKYAGLNRADVLAQWAANGAKASADGTEMHADIESYYQRENLDAIPQTKEFRLFANYHREHYAGEGRPKPYRSEMIVWDPETRIC